MTDPLKPGPTSDAIVAVVVGWRLTTCREQDYWWLHPDGRIVTQKDLPRFTTTWAGLGAMVEWMRAKPRQWKIMLHSPDNIAWDDGLPYRKGWVCDVRFGDGAGESGLADTAPLAVGEALLAAVEATR